jgi:hypothetical protein
MFARPGAIVAMFKDAHASGVLLHSVKHLAPMVGGGAAIPATPVERERGHGDDSR